MRRRIPKPFSEKTLAEQVAEAKASIDRLRHPHNRYMPSVYQAIDRWNEFLTRHGEPRY